MDNDQKNIKQDLLYVYEALYVSVNRDGGSLFDKRFVKKLKYTPEQIKNALELGNSNAKSSNPVSSTKNLSTITITNLDELRNYYYSDLNILYDNNCDDEFKSKLLDTISIDELKRLYTIISCVSLPSKIRKKDIVDLIRHYFSDEARTAGLAKKL